MWPLLRVDWSGSLPIDAFCSGLRPMTTVPTRSAAWSGSLSSQNRRTSQPASRSCGSDPPITGHVCHELFVAPFLVVLGSGSVFGSPMPEASVHEDRDPGRSEHHVRPASDSGQQVLVDTKAEALAVECRPERDFWLGFPTSLPTEASLDVLVERFDHTIACSFSPGQRVAKQFRRREPTGRRHTRVASAQRRRSTFRAETFPRPSRDEDESCSRRGILEGVRPHAA
jgi:hypothetical protein